MVTIPPLLKITLVRKKKRFCLRVDDLPTYIVSFDFLTLDVIDASGKITLEIDGQVEFDEVWSFPNATKLGLWSYLQPVRFKGTKDINLFC
jgi:hypothetical protein